MDVNQMNPSEEILDVNEQIAVRMQKLSDLKESGNDPFLEIRFDRDTEAKDIIANFTEHEGKIVKIAGRMMSKRIMGKASFCHIYDGSENIQLYFRIDAIGEDKYAEFKKLDIGDIIGLTGEVFLTHKGEISIKVAEYKLLAKALRPLPEKFHGLTNPDLRYRQRYVDLIVNPEVKDAFVKRSQIMQAIREYLNAKGYIEVETPILNSILGGANARPFVTHHNTLDIDMYLRIAPELYLKRLIVGGFSKVYEIGRLFRNEGMDTKHNPEFTTIELYEAYTDYNDMMDITEGMFKYCSNKIQGTEKIIYQGVDIDLSSPWERITMADCVKKHTGLDFYAEGVEDLLKKARKLGADIPTTTSWGKILYETFDQLVEEKLIQPTFVIDYPIEISPLAKKKKDDPRLVERFEVFITAREMGNAFSELNDPIDQKERFMDQANKREKGDEEAQMMDEDYVNALEYGLPPTGGLGIGIDRMVMLLTDSASIRDVLLFPTMKPLAK